MKVRVIRKPNFLCLHHVQKKVWYWPFWVDVHRDDIERCKLVAENLLKTKSPVEVVMQGETK